MLFFVSDAFSEIRIACTVFLIILRRNFTNRMRSLYTFFFLATIITSCDQSGQPAQQSESEISESQTKQVLDHHWEAFKNNDLEETMKDYTEESVLITPNATYNGLAEIRNNFINAFKLFPKDSSEFTLDKSIVVKDVGYILWKSKTPTFNLTYGTDTFIIRDGKIIRQTYAGVTE